MANAAETLRDVNMCTYFDLLSHYSTLSESKMLIVHVLSQSREG